MILPGKTAPERLPSAFLAEWLLSEHDPDYAQARRQHAAAVKRGARLPLHAQRTFMYAYDNKTVRASLPRGPLDAHYHVKWTPGEPQAFLRSPWSAWLVIVLCVSVCVDDWWCRGVQQEALGRLQCVRPLRHVRLDGPRPRHALPGRWSPVPALPGAAVECSAQAYVWCAEVRACELPNASCGLATAADPWARGALSHLPSMRGPLRPATPGAAAR